jgi:hypothetical protein
LDVHVERSCGKSCGIVEIAHRRISPAIAHTPNSRGIGIGGAKDYGVALNNGIDKTT